MLRLAVFLAAVAAAFALAAPASASYLLARNATDVELAVNAGGMAMITYRAPSGGVRHVLAWGAIDEDLNFKLDYSGGFKTFKKPVWKTFKDKSTAYDGAPLAWLVAARKAPDGSYWALQAWQRNLPVLGKEPTTALHTAWELRLSHWSGELPKLEVWQDWIYTVRLENLIARVTYKGKPVFGFKATPAGRPLDPYGRNVYVDSFNSSYSPGWHRANALLTHNPTGVVCMAFADGDFLPGKAGINRGRGERYRATVPGPGVAPDAYWEGPTIGRFDPDNPAHVARDADMNALVDALGEKDPRCTDD